ncbi:MAG: substrate-binding domain-containing protein [Desulfurococcaceae archaeon]
MLIKLAFRAGMRKAASTLIIVMAVIVVVIVTVQYIMVIREKPALFIYTDPSAYPLINTLAIYYELKNDVDLRVISTALPSLLARIIATNTGDIIVTPDHMSMIKIMEHGLVHNETVKPLSLVIPSLLVNKGVTRPITGLSDLVKNVHVIGVVDPSYSFFGEISIQLLIESGVYDDVENKLVVYQDIPQLARQVALGVVDTAILPSFTHNWYPEDTYVVWLTQSNVSIPVTCQMIGVLKYTSDYERANSFLNYVVEFVEKGYASRLGYVLRGVEEYVANTLPSICRI